MTKKRMFGCAVILIAGIYPGLFLSCNAHYFLSGQKGVITIPSQLISVFILEKNIRMFFLIYSALLLAFICWTMAASMTISYRAGMREIIPGIKTPLPCGENQYGSARWLPYKKYKEAFSKVKMNGSGDCVKWLVARGDADLADDYDSSGDPSCDIKLFDEGGLVVGQTKNGNSMYIVGEDTHSLTIGATRSSKSRSVVIPSACVTALAGESIIFSDPKGELYFYMAPFLRRLGYEVIAIDFEHPGKSARYNFLQPVIDALERRDTAAAKLAIWELVEALVGDVKGEPIWHNGECSIIACCIMAVAYDNMNSPQYQNLTNVYHFISRMCTSRDDGKAPLQDYLDQLAEDHPAKTLAGISNVAHWRTKSSFYASALATLRLFEDFNIADMTSRTDFDIYETGNAKRAIFIILPDEKHAYYSIASLFVFQHYQTLVGVAKKHGGRLPRRVELFLDEIGNFAYIPNFEKLLTVGGGRGIRFHLFLQATQQLDEVYNQNISSIIRTNCDTWLYLQSNDYHQLEELSKKLGSYTTKSPNLSASASGGSSASYSYMSRSLLTPDEIKQIKRPYQLVFSRSDPVILYAPDVSKTKFNRMLGLGDKRHNLMLTQIRNERRPERRISAPKLWGIWLSYQSVAPPIKPRDSQLYKKTNF